jgi:CheY-like chemotaxis protein/anti-sigma regulatory factor (Ser/Thr protein kinase)
VIHAAVQAVHPAAAAKGILLQVHADSAEATVAGDEARLQQAIWNLLVNAVKFTPKGGSVEISLRRTGDLAIVSVHDEGAGIPADALPFIFDRFRQADSRTTRAHGGLGLGLAIVQYVAQAHGGSIAVQSPGPGLGTTFELAVPLPAETAAPAPEEPAAAARPDLTGRQILVVDDEPDVLELMRTILEQSGAEVIGAGSVTEAVGVARTRCPDILVGDIGMPDQDGYDLIRLLRAMPECRDLRALAVTAYASTDHREAALDAGYDAHLSKPVDPDRLCEALGRLLPART